jgi:hypothetical protein
VAPLRRQRREVLLAGLESLDLLARRALEIHPEPQDREHDPRNAGRDVLRHLPALLACEFLNLRIVGGNFGLLQRSP